MPTNEAFKQTKKVTQQLNLQVTQTTQQIDYLNETEKQVIEEVNKLRAHPAKYAEMNMVPLLKRYSGNKYKDKNGVNIITEEGVKAVEECIAELKNTKPLESLQPSLSLSKSAKDHANDQAKNGGIGHTGSDGSKLDKRIAKYGKWIRSIAENIDYGNKDAKEIILSLLIDDGVPNRGHRKNLLSGDVKLIGVAVGTHPEYSYMCVMNFAYGIQ